MRRGCLQEYRHSRSSCGRVGLQPRKAFQKASGDIEAVLRDMKELLFPGAWWWPWLPPIAARRRASGAAGSSSAASTSGASKRGRVDAGVVAQGELTELMIGSETDLPVLLVVTCSN